LDGHKIISNIEYYDRTPTYGIAGPFRPRSHGMDDHDHAGRMNTEHHAGTSYSGAIASPSSTTTQVSVANGSPLRQLPRTNRVSLPMLRATRLHYPFPHTPTELLCPPRNAASSIFAIQISARVCRLQPPEPAHEREIASAASNPAIIVLGTDKE